MQIPTSTIWLAVILIGGGMLAVGNIFYQSAKDRERGEAAGEKALAMLKTEFKSNLTRADSMRVSATANQVSLEGFERTAWNIVSTGGLLVQLPQSTLGQVSQIYYLIGLAEDYRVHLIELNTGISAAMQGANVSRQQYLTLWSYTLDQLIPKLKEVTPKP